jgi:hypothetical protein
MPEENTIPDDWQEQLDYLREHPERYTPKFEKVEKEATPGMLETAKQRYSTCQGCADFYYKFCKHCGCFMPLKTLLPMFECPIGKWTKLEKIN